MGPGVGGDGIGRTHNWLDVAMNKERCLGFLLGGRSIAALFIVMGL